MPNITLTLPDTAQSIMRPIAYDIINQVSKITKFNKDTNIFFPGDSQINRTPGSSIDDQDQERFAKFKVNNINFIEVNEDFEEEALRTTAVTRKEQRPVFYDSALNVVITPVYVTTNVTINFKYRCVSKTEAFRWRDDMRVRLSQYRDINLHDITYQYLLPLDILVILQAINETKEMVMPYNESYIEYIVRNSTQRLSLIGDLVNKETRLSVAETQCRIQGLYDWDTVPEKPEREDTGTYTINFNYKFSYEKPVAVNFRYPIMVHNNLLPPAYTYFTNQSYNLYDINKSYSLSFSALNAFETDTQILNVKEDKAYFHLPEFDDYMLPYTPNGTGTVFTALCQVDNDKKTLVNLDELDTLVMDNDILKYIIESEYPYICNLYQSILYISLYRNNALASNETIKCSQSLAIAAINELDLRQLYHIRFSIITDLTLLSKTALDRLRNYPKALVKIVAAINDILRNHPDLNSLGDKSSISIQDFQPVYVALTGFALDNGRGIGKGQYYGHGRPINGWPNQGRDYQGYGLFGNIDPRILEQYRNNRINFNRVMATGIIAQRETNLK